jgi:hypothetical protein
MAEGAGLGGTLLVAVQSASRYAIDEVTASKELLTLKVVTRQSNEFSCKELLRVR